MPDDRFDVSDKDVIITGAGQGIGREYAQAFGEAGAIPIIAELNGQNAQKVSAKVEKNGGRALAVETDVGSEDSVKTMVDQTLDAYSRIDVLINNAAMFAVLPQRKFDDIPLDEWDQVML